MHISDSSIGGALACTAVPATLLWPQTLTQANERMYAPVVGCRRTLLSASRSCGNARGEQPTE